MKEVKIYIESTVEEIDDAGLTESSEKTESRANGKIEKTDSEIRISYSETEESVTTNTLVKVSNGEVTVRRDGGVEYEFLFKEGLKTTSVYCVPPYTFDSEIYTRKIRSSITEEDGEISLFYDMTIGGAKKRVRMKIKVAKI